LAERGSTQHSPRVDDELERETEPLVRSSHESHTEEWRQMEPPAEGEPLPDRRISVDPIELRSILAMSLRPSAFPGDRARLLDVAEEEQAEDQVLDWLRQLPADREFVNVEAVWEALGGQREEREHEPPREEHEHEPPPAARPSPAPNPPQLEPSASIVDRVTGIAVAGVELAVGLMVEAYQRVRRLL
jgi:hypothetical protein